jgi:hypothetical protein
MPKGYRVGGRLSKSLEQPLGGCVTLDLNVEQHDQRDQSGSHDQGGTQSENNHVSSSCDCIVNILIGTIDAEACARLAQPSATQLAMPAENLMKSYSRFSFFLTNALHLTLTFKQGINHKD